MHQRDLHQNVRGRFQMRIIGLQVQFALDNVAVVSHLRIVGHLRRDADGHQHRISPAEA